MKKISVMIVCIFLCGILFTGCGAVQKEEETPAEIPNDEAVVGTWTEDYFDSGYTFSADGTGSDVFWDLSFTYTAHDGVVTITYDDETYAPETFSYSVDGNTLILTSKSDSSKSFTYTKR